jgi:putative Mg2+ transporter-C (MgtC) family protein
MDWTLQLLILGEVALAIVLGGLIGIEREIANRPAGFRTHMLIAGSAALLVGLANALIEDFNAISSVDQIASDPMRIVQAIITGISFIGAGTIFRGDGDRVEGLTTAASLLCTAGIGIAVALQQFILAVGTTALVLLVLRVLGLVQKGVRPRRIQRISQRREGHKASPSRGQRASNGGIPGGRRKIRRLMKMDWIVGQFTEGGIALMATDSGFSPEGRGRPRPLRPLRAPLAPQAAFAGSTPGRSI